MTENETQDNESLRSLHEETVALGKILRKIANDEPVAQPSPAAATAFHTWLDKAGPFSRVPNYFVDVVTNFTPAENTNKDLWNLFDMLAAYLDSPEEPLEEEPQRTFINLPLFPPPTSAH